MGKSMIRCIALTAVLGVMLALPAVSSFAADSYGDREPVGTSSCVALDTETGCSLVQTSDYKKLGAWTDDGEGTSVKCRGQAWEYDDDYYATSFTDYNTVYRITAQNIEQHRVHCRNF